MFKKGFRGCFKVVEKKGFKVLQGIFKEAQRDIEVMKCFNVVSRLY